MKSLLEYLRTTPALQVMKKCVIIIDQVELREIFMFKTISILIFITVATNLFAASDLRLIGSYSATYDQLPISNEYHFSGENELTFIEHGAGWTLECSGRYESKPSFIIARLKCDRMVNKIEIKLHTNNIRNTERFKALTYNSLYDYSFVMDFKRLED